MEKEETPVRRDTYPQEMDCDMTPTNYYITTMTIIITTYYYNYTTTAYTILCFFEQAS